MLEVADFLDAPGALLDVRSPKEFQHAHIQGAIALPLFDNEERSAVGTCYKQQSSQDAVALGLGLLAAKSDKFLASAPEGPLRIHCWRGGMRSQTVAKLFSLTGHETCTLRGGYKAYRNWVLLQFMKCYQLRVLTGLTGAGKTEHLHALATAGEQVIDLEGLAEHRGSAFGAVPGHPQPSCELFENRLAEALFTLDTSRPIWIEDESRMIGRCAIPQHFMAQLVKAPMTVVTASEEERLDRIERDYGSLGTDFLVKATLRITKKLGSQATREVIENLERGAQRDAFRCIMRYYDKSYKHSFARRSRLSL